MTSNTTNLKEATRLKAEILAEGIDIAPSVLENYGKPYIIKRRAYGNQDPVDLWKFNIPQEIYLSDKSIVVSTNVRRGSPWKLSYQDGTYTLSHETKNINKECSFPLYPEFYDRITSEGKGANEILTLYGGKSLAIFVYGSCSLVEMDKACQYCSIQQNRSKNTEFQTVLRPENFEAALREAFDVLPPHVNQVMINGGNFKDLNKNFQFYTDFVRVATKLIQEYNLDIETHLIVYPPDDLSLIEQLQGLNMSISMNTEVFDPVLFEKYCPGKAIIAGQEHTFNALKKAVDVLGKGKVYSILVGGLEPLDSLKMGLEKLESLGVTPVINVFHPDPGTPLENHPAPQAETIVQMGKMLQEVFERNSHMKPFYTMCGRNSLDTEAYLHLF